MQFQAVVIKLFEVIHASLEELLLMAAGDVEADMVVDDAFGMAHLAEHAAIRAGDAFDGAGGTIGIPWHVSGRFAVEIAIAKHLKVLYITVVPFALGVKVFAF